LHAPPNPAGGEALLADGVRAARDRALLLVGFAGGFRRSEIVGLNAEDIQDVRQDLVISLRRSKADQGATAGGSAFH
jgi:site-specific recombinase XerD